MINWITNYIFVKIGLQALLKLRTDLYSYLQSLSLKFHDARRSSDSSFRVAYDSQSIQTIYNKGFTNIFARSSRWSEPSSSCCSSIGSLRSFL